MLELKQILQSYTHQPLTHQLLISLLKDYKRPNDKIHELLKSGILKSIKKGLYMIGSGLNGGRPESFLLANHILGPSYVSMDSSLSFYGLIPEQVFEISSMTVKASRKFNTEIGVFSYTKLPLPYYSFDIRSISLSGSKDQYAMIASPEKALFDKIITTSGLTLRSKKYVMTYLLENLRIDEDNLRELNTKTMAEWISEAPKKESLIMIIKALESL
jgi:hypothetical protein